MGTKLNFSLLELDAIDSTNNYLSKLNNTSNVTNGTVILAYEQTHGKGQRGNTWQSNPHENLTFSIFYQPQSLDISHQFLLSMCVANALHSFLSDRIEGVTIKWPNDMLVKHKKIAGILIENSLQKNQISSSIIGIGLNVNQRNFGDLATATSLAIETATNYLLKDLIWEILTHLNIQFKLLDAKQYELIKAYYMKHLYGSDHVFTFRESASGSVFKGQIIDIKPNGELIVTQGNETKGYLFKEIEFEL